MRPGGGNPKGGAFERKVAVQLSLWMSRDKHQDWFWRTAMSGGRATVFAKKGISLKNQVGDICAIDEKSFKFSNTFYIECKNYKDLGLKNLITGTHSKTVQWWDKLLEDSFKVDKVPLLIMKQGHMFPLLAMDSLGLVTFGIRRKLLHRNMSFIAWYPHYDFYMFSFEDFLAYKSPKKVKYSV